MGQEAGLKNHWSDEEVLFLTDNYEEMTDEEIGEKLGRTVHSIRGKRCILNLIKKRNKGWFNKIPMPTREELEKLYLERNKSPSEIALLWKVSSNTVIRWLRQYDIPIKRPYTSYVSTDLSETEEAYLAGYLDGDGTITASLWKSKRNKRGYGVHYDVSLITKNKDFVHKLQKIVGGKIGSFIYEDSREKKEGYKLGFMNQASALAFLRAIVSYLILKKRQAELTIDFLENRLEARRKRGNSAVISNESWKKIEEVRKLNRS